MPTSRCTPPSPSLVSTSRKPNTRFPNGPVDICFLEGFAAGTIVNWAGIKWSLSFGGLGYVIYVASFLSYNHNHNKGFSIFAGAFLGCCAGILWSAQGAIMMSYPPEGSKGRYISWFWMIFNLGGVIGSLVSLDLLTCDSFREMLTERADPSWSEHPYHVQ